MIDIPKSKKILQLIKIEVNRSKNSFIESSAELAKFKIFQKSSQQDIDKDLDNIGPAIGCNKNQWDETAKRYEVSEMAHREDLKYWEEIYDYAVNFFLDQSQNPSHKL